MLSDESPSDRSLLIKQATFGLEPRRTTEAARVSNLDKRDLETPSMSQVLKKNKSTTFHSI